MFHRACGSCQEVSQYRMLSSLGLVAKMAKESLQVILGKVVAEVYEIHLARAVVRLGTRRGVNGSHHWIWLEEKPEMMLFQAT